MKTEKEIKAMYIEVCKNYERSVIALSICKKGTPLYQVNYTKNLIFASQKSILEFVLEIEE